MGYTQSSPNFSFSCPENILNPRIGSNFEWAKNKIGFWW